MRKKELKKAVEELVEAIRVTQELVKLPAAEGWPWYDALVKHAPEVAAHLRSKYLHPTGFTATTGSSSSCCVSGCNCGTVWVTNLEAK